MATPILLPNFSDDDNDEKIITPKRVGLLLSPDRILKENRVLSLSYAAAVLDPVHHLFDKTPPTPVREGQELWNAQFQTAIEMEEGDKKYLLLSKVCSDFDAAVRVYAHVILREQFMRDEDKTIGITKKGIAGGDKYFVRGIVFKSCRDPLLPDGRFVYGGNQSEYELAAKAAGHELRGAQVILDAVHPILQRKQPTVRVPVMCAVDYMGFRMIAVGLVPISGGAILYGSGDGGKTVRADPDVHSMMAPIAEHIHLAAHNVNGATLMAAGDIEGHLGEDGRYYLLDLARLMPCEPPDCTPHLYSVGQTVFYRLFRPELLRRLKRHGGAPLSSDAFTGFSIRESDADAMNKRSLACGKFLILTVIPEFAAEINSSPDVTAFLSPFPGLSQVFHRRGINMRHLGLVRSMVKNPLAKLWLLVEMVARVLKNHFRKAMRDAMSRSHNYDSEAQEPQDTIVNFLNSVTTKSPASSGLWADKVPKGVRLRFGKDSMNMGESRDLFSAVQIFLPQILSYLLESTGLAMSPTLEKEFRERFGGESSSESQPMQQQSYLKRALPSSEFHFTRADQFRIGTRVKHYDLINFAYGKVLRKEATVSRIPSFSSRLLHVSAREFEACQQANPLNLKASVESAIARMCAYEGVGELKKADKAIEDVIKGGVYDKVALHELCTMVISTWARRVQRFPELAANQGATQRPILELLLASAYHIIRPLMRAQAVCGYLASELTGEKLQKLDLNGLRLPEVFTVADLIVTSNLKTIRMQAVIPVTELKNSSAITITDKLTLSDVVVIGTLIQSNRSLTELNMANTGLQDGSIIPLLFALRESSITTLDLSHNRIGSLSAKCLARILKENNHNTKLTRLDLSFNQIESDGIRSLCRAIKLNKTLKVLNLAANRLDDSSFQDLATMITNNHHIADLRVNPSGHITKKSYFLMAEAMKRSKTLRHLDLWSAEPVVHTRSLTLPNILPPTGNQMRNERLVKLKTMFDLKEEKRRSSRSISRRSFDDDEGEGDEDSTSSGDDELEDDMDDSIVSRSRGHTGTISDGGTMDKDHLLAFGATLTAPAAGTFTRRRSNQLKPKMNERQSAMTPAKALQFEREIAEILGVVFDREILFIISRYLLPPGPIDYLVKESDSISTELARLEAKMRALKERQKWNKIKQLDEQHRTDRRLSTMRRRARQL